MSSQIRSIGDLLRRLGNVPPDRLRFQPAPGTATVADVDRLRAKEDVLCELIEGVLLEKTVGYRESALALYLGAIFNAYVRPRNLGIVAGADGAVQLGTALVRIPDVAFYSWRRLPGGTFPSEPVPAVVPNIAAEVLSAGNTVGEMAAKREDYFRAGVELVWEIDPQQRTVDVYTTPTEFTTFGAGENLDGGTVLPGFQLPLTQLFGELDRHG